MPRATLDAVLRVLAELGEEAVTGAVAQKLVCSPAQATRRLEELRGLGMVERVMDERKRLVWRVAK